MSERLQVKEPTGLMLFLSAQLQGWARSKIKQRLQSGCVSVNGSTLPSMITRFKKVIWWKWG